MIPWLQLSVLSAIFVLPFDTVRSFFLGMPFSLPEMATIGIGIAFFVSKNRIAPLPRWVWICFSLLILGALSSVAYQAFFGEVVSQETVMHRGFGILKAWFLLPFLFGWLLYQSIGTNGWFRRMAIFGVAGSAFALSSSALLSGGFTYDGRLVGGWQSPNFLALFLAPLWPFFLCILCRECSSKKKSLLRILLSLFGSAIVLLTLFLTRSSGGMIAADVSALLFFSFGFPRPFKKYLRFVWALFVAGSLLFGTMLLKNASLQEYFSLASRSSFASRVMIWRSSAKMLADSPVFGIGPGNFQDMYLAYQRFFPPYLEWAVPEPHNIFLAFWLHAGIIGLTAFLGLLFLWFRALFHALPGASRLESATLLSALSAILIHGLVDTPYWRTNLAFLFWTLFFLGLSIALDSRSKEVTH